MVLQTMMSSKGYKLKEDAKFKILETKLNLDLISNPNRIYSVLTTSFFLFSKHAGNFSYR